MALTLIFAAIGIVIFIGFLGEWIFDKTNIPDVTWLMLLGIVMGLFTDIPSDPAFQRIAPIFTTFALIFILFEGAINIDLKKLIEGVVGGSSLSFLNFLLSIIVVPIAMYFLGWGILEGILLGAMIGGASSAVIIPLTKKISIKPQTSLVLTFESAISDVLCIVGSLTILNIIVGLNEVSVSSVMQNILYSFAVATLLGIIGGLLWVRLHKMMDTFSKSYMTTIAALLLLYSFVEYLESNGAIACLAFGIVLGNSKKIYDFIDKEKKYNMGNDAKFFFSQISFFVKTFFFVYLGLIIDLSDFPMIVVGFVLTVLLYLTRPIAVAIANRKLRFAPKDKIFMEILSPKGLAAAVLAQLPAQNNIPFGEQFSTIVLSVILFSILISTVGVFMTEKGKFPGTTYYFRKLAGKRNSAKSP